MNKFARYLAPASLATLGASAMAAVPAEITAAIDGMEADGLVVATAVTVAVIVIAAAKFLRRAT